jgi:hypothetical protein
MSRDFLFYIPVIVELIILILLRITTPNLFEYRKDDFHPTAGLFMGCVVGLIVLSVVAGLSSAVIVDCFDKNLSHDIMMISLSVGGGSIFTALLGGLFFEKDPDGMTSDW